MTETMAASVAPSERAILLSVESLCVTYGAYHAVQDVSFSVYGGEIFGLLGPNGAGKTSTLSAIEGLLKPNAGRIHVAGIDIGARPLEARAQIGVQLQATSFQPELTVSEILRLYAGIYGIRLSAGGATTILEDYNLGGATGKRFGQLSGGQQQRLSLAIAMLHQPKLILLDEPTTGLDPQSRRQLWQRIESLRDRGHAIVLTTHSMEEAESVCDRIAIMDAGHIIALDRPEQIIEKHRCDESVIRASRKGRVTLEDVFIGLTGTRIRS